MNRNDFILFSLGGGANRLVDAICQIDSRFKGDFINTSISDIKGLASHNEAIKNYFCISQQNGVGRNREIGKAYATQNASALIDRMCKYQQDTIYLVYSLGGGSGSSIASTLLSAIDGLKSEGVWTKTINVICILPDLNSPDIILSNALDTWKETLSCKCINSMIVVDNNVNIGASTANDKELQINYKFAELFDSIFEISDDTSGVAFDEGNLSNLLRDKGCLYIYDLPSNQGGVLNALKKAESSSVIAKMFKSDMNTVTNYNGTTAIKCGYLGMSFADNMYDTNEVLANYSVKKETYINSNEEKNLILISGCLPPYNSIKVIEQELIDRSKNVVDDEEDVFGGFSQVTNPFVNNSTPRQQVVNNTNNQQPNQTQQQQMKKIMKKGLFKR